MLSLSSRGRTRHHSPRISPSDVSIGGALSLTMHARSAHDIPAGALAAARGNLRVHVMPCPCTLSTVTTPPCAAVISCAMYSPKPVPPSLVVYRCSFPGHKSPTFYHTQWQQAYRHPRETVMPQEFVYPVTARVMHGSGRWSHLMSLNPGISWARRDMRRGLYVWIGRRYSKSLRLDT
jgi:hypothetical protein